MRFAETAETGRQLLDMMAGYFALTGQIVMEAGGRLIKTMGDAGLVAFPAEAVGAGVLAFRSVQAKGQRVVGRTRLQGHVVVKLHAGPVAIGRVGGPGLEILDVFGKTVNVAATLPSTGLAMTPAVFRSLPAETRTRCSRSTRRRSPISTRPTRRLIPTTQAIVAARVDSRPETERTLLQTAAVIGREFMAPILEHVAGIAGSLVSAALPAGRWPAA